MSWTTPLTAVSNSPLTAAQWNASVRDNLNETAPAKASSSGTIFAGAGANTIAQRTVTFASIATSEGTAVTSYGALTTPGPSVSITTGTNALAWVTAQVSQSTTSAFACYSLDVSGATTIAASDADAMMWQPSGASSGMRASACIAYTAQLTPGLNNFISRYRASAGTATFQNRKLAVIGL